MSQAETKALRLLQIEMLLLAHPEGMTQAQIARKLGVHRSTVHRYLPDLTQHSAVYEDEGRLFINRGAHLINMQLNLHEAMAILLAVRLLTTRMERHNPHAAAAIRKLAERIEPVSSQISGHLRLSADLMDDVLRYQDPRYMEVLETLTLAWAEGRVVDVWHRHTGTGQVYQYAFEPYFLEPYAVGQAIHAVGLRRPPGEIRTFNLARIERVEITRDYYRIPEDFDPAELLAQAWGIWYGEGDSQKVKLAFSPAVAGRVGETQWHPSQKVTQRSDGWLVWTAEIAEPKEMLPWIRGWGADVEVLEPGWVRSRIINEIGAMERIYMHKARESFMEMWAKFTRDDEEDWHPLLWHLLDSAAVAQLLWEGCLSNSFKHGLADIFDLSVDEMGRLVAFWVGLHDIGKAGPAFQKKNQLRREALENLGFIFPPERYKADGFHATATTLILQRIWEQDAHIPQSFGQDLALTLGGHHGEFPDNREIIQTLAEPVHVGDQLWQSAQSDLYEALKKCLNPPIPKKFPEGNDGTNPISLLFAGLTTTADWIASNENYFPFLNVVMAAEDYLALARSQAEKALQTLGWYGWKAQGETASFEDLFPGFKPNPIQKKVIDLSSDLEAPFMMIVEAPTGSGKTEGALFLADTILQRDQKAGIYVAMPTQATSNQMFERVAAFLARRYSEDEINLHLVHGAALLKDIGEVFDPTNIWGDDGPQNANLHSHAWFLPRKRTLLAPFGVGTVDQTFLSVMKSRHFFLRLFGLGHKVLIFDEVHAYDVYMSEIFQRLLHWLRAVGTSVIILSATLPAHTREELLRAYGAVIPDDETPGFPRISTAKGDRANLIEAGRVEDREIRLDWIDREEASIVTALKTKLAEGGCAAVICNRVRRAQAVYDAVRAAFDGSDPAEVILFHSRFPHCWRQEIEETVLRKFGKDTPERPHKAVVIATQVIEQSLDLDFDLMISDLAPMDLLIQRIGRLHRHADRANPPARPGGLDTPWMILSAPEAEGEDSLPAFGKDTFIYSDYILQRTHLALRDRKVLSLPGETDGLINVVYTENRPEDISDRIWQHLSEALEKMRSAQARSSQKARRYLIPQSRQSMLGSLRSFFSDDVQDVSRKTLKAPTREFSPSLQIVCLVQEEDDLHILEHGGLINLDAPLSRDQVRACLKAAAALSDWRVLKYFFEQTGAVPEAFRRSAALRGHIPVIFQDSVFETDSFTLRLDRKRGIQVFHP